jgi:hypothetical protein
MKESAVAGADRGQAFETAVTVELIFGTILSDEIEHGTN